MSAVSNRKGKIRTGKEPYYKDLYSSAAMYTALKIYGGKKLKIADDALKAVEEKKLREFEALLDKIPDAGFGFVVFSFRDGEPDDKSPEYFWIADASEVKDLWRDNAFGELLEAGVTADSKMVSPPPTSLNPFMMGGRKVPGNLEFIMRDREGKSVATTVRRCLEEFVRTDDSFYDTVIVTESLGEDVCKIFENCNAHNLPE